MGFISAEIKKQINGIAIRLAYDAPKNLHMVPVTELKTKAAVLLDKNESNIVVTKNGCSMFEHEHANFFVNAEKDIAFLLELVYKQELQLAEQDKEISKLKHVESVNATAKDTKTYQLSLPAVGQSQAEKLQTNIIATMLDEYHKGQMVFSNTAYFNKDKNLSISHDTYSGTIHVKTENAHNNVKKLGPMKTTYWNYHTNWTPDYEADETFKL